MNEPTPATPTPEQCAQVAQTHRGRVRRWDGDLVVEWCERCGCIRTGVRVGAQPGRVIWELWRFPESAK